MNSTDLKTDSFPGTGFIAAVSGVKAFSERCKIAVDQYKLTPNSDLSPFSICFGIFLDTLLLRRMDKEDAAKLLAKKIDDGLRRYKREREAHVELIYDKAYLQLLAFSLSALSALQMLKDFPLDDIISPSIPKDMCSYLNRVGAFDGVPQSGNLAMCMAVLSIYARESLGVNTDRQISDWVNGHLDRMNSNGFWGAPRTTHLQFQNGYHQYEILEYLEVDNPKIDDAVSFVKRIADRRGQFAPYFGGSGCYDYDAVSIITSPAHVLTDSDKDLLRKTAMTILSEQNSDGGFSESQWVRPRSFKSVLEGVRHISTGEMDLTKERLRYFLALLRPKYSRVHTHWTQYSRQWSESNLWDTWFRLLTLAKIECAFDSTKRKDWGFIDFPGIGFFNGITEGQRQYRSH